MYISLLSTRCMTFISQCASLSAEEGSESSNSLPIQLAMGVGLYALALLTCIGNAMVIQAIRTEKKLRKVRLYILSFIFLLSLYPSISLLIN